MSTIRIRKAIPDDREAIGRLWLELMRDHREWDPRFLYMKPDALDIWLQHLDECMADENQFVLVAEGDGELIGLAMGRPGEDPPVFSTPPHGFVTTFVVASKSRRSGVGKLLFGELAKEFNERGIHDLRLSVAATNPASNAFWRRMGFEAYSCNMRRGTKP